MKKIIYLLSAMLFLGSCSDFLEKEPLNKVGAESFYNTESALELHTNGFIVKYMPSVAKLCWGDENSDILAEMVSDNFLTSNWSPEQQTSGWTTSDWNKIYNVNYFLSRMYEAEGAVKDDVKMKHYEGCGRFWRAWLYFDKVKLFGNVPWYDKPIDPKDKEQLYKGRDSRAFVMQKILEDLNFACEHCSIDAKYVNTNRINRYIALALKVRICLFEGTYRKYHTELGLQETAEDWLGECVSACKELMNNSPYSLVNNPSNVKTQYRNLFTQEAVNTQEVLFANEFNESKARFHYATWKFSSGSYGNKWSPVKSFINTYLNLDGSRFTDEKDFNKKTYYEEMQNRDYRLAQTVISPLYTKKVEGITKRVAPDFSLTLTGYQVIKWSLDDSKYEGIENSINSLPVFRFAEVLLNYAEAKAELNSFTEADWNQTIRLLRERSGVVGTAPLTVDPYLADYYGINDKWILEIRRERAIELFMEGFRYDDLMRWKLGDKLVRDFDGIYIPKIGEAMDLNKDGKNDVCFVYSNPGSEAGVFYFDLSKTIGYSINEDNCLVYKDTRIWNDRKYLHPIPKKASNINSALLPNNEGWE